MDTRQNLIAVGQLKKGSKFHFKNETQKFTVLYHTEVKTHVKADTGTIIPFHLQTLVIPC